MADVKTVVEQLIEKTKAGDIPWEGIIDERGDLEGYKATRGDVEFKSFLDQPRLHINGACFSEDEVSLDGLHEAIRGWLSERNSKRYREKVDQALEMAAKVLR